MKNCVFSHNIITLTLPCSLLFLCRFYYPILAVNYHHLRAFVKEAILVANTFISWKHLGTLGLKCLFFQNNTANTLRGLNPASPQGADQRAADSTEGLSAGYQFFSKHSLPVNFWRLLQPERFDEFSELPISTPHTPTKERQLGEPPCWWDGDSTLLCQGAEATSQVMHNGISGKKLPAQTDVLSPIFFPELSADCGSPDPPMPINIL